MRHSLSSVAVVVTLALSSAPAWAVTATIANASGQDTATAGPSGPPPAPVSPMGDRSTPTPPVLPGMTAYVLMDAATGAVLAEAAPDLHLPPASLTKLMTAHLTYQALEHGALKPDQTVPVSTEAWHAGGSRMFISPTSVVTVDQLLHGLIIDSGNDAAVALAEQVAGSEPAFVQMMNTEAQKLGLNDTSYANVTGLPDPAMYTSAMDVAKLSRVILSDEPEILSISKEPSYTYNDITQASWNPVLRHDPTVDGLKTGLTKESGHCIDATGIRHGARLIAVVTGGPTWHASTAAIESLLDYGERFFTDLNTPAPGTQIALLTSPALQPGKVAVGAASSVTMTVPADAAGKLATAIAYTVDPAAGVTKGEVVGTVTFSLNGKAVGSVPAVALADAPAANMLTRLQRRLGNML
jgi:D-alanyl-D-alanine carboxypeptidase (penicillin-binding protein 5/6)